MGLFYVYKPLFGSVLRLLLARVAAICMLVLTFIPFSYAAPKPDVWGVWLEPSTPVALPDASAFADFLQRYQGVNSDGIATIDYTRVTAQDTQQLQGFITSYTAIDPRGLARAEQFVYWVNLYNAQIIMQILDAGIPESIKDIRPGLSGLLAGGPWKAKQLEVAGRDISFNDIEHRILRPIWGDARVHFVLNCASLGCPDIPVRPLSPVALEQQLNAAAEAFLNHSRAVALHGSALVLSSLFDWFAMDFGADETQRIAFINRYRFQPITSYQSITYEYDWALNAPQAAR